MKTYALGSCVALIVYDKNLKISGLAHIALPNTLFSENEKPPAYFADKAIPLLFKKMGDMGANRASSWIKLVGGAAVIKDSNYLDIGNRNVLEIRKIIWKQGLGPIAEDIGGEISRTVEIEVATGKITISNKGKKWSI